MAECPHEEDLRAASPLAEALRAGDVPLPILAHGVMPMLRPGVQTDFWGRPSGDKDASIVPPQPPQFIQPFLQEHAWKIAEGGLQQLARAVKGPHPPPIHMQQQRERDNQHRDEDRQCVYTDGSVDHPRWPQYALAGAAAVEHHGKHGEQGQGQDLRPYTERDDYADRMPLEAGTAWHAHVEGPVMSSTRAEIIAGFIAAAKPGHMTIYTDSKGFRAMHKRVCAAYAGMKVRPYVMQPNGDLAKAWMRLLEAKTPQGLVVKWIKGHTEQDYAKWGLTEAQMRGNKDADNAADYAAQNAPSGRSMCSPGQGQIMRHT